MMSKLSQWAEHKSSWFVLFATSLGLQIAALYFQYGMGLQPCIMCIYQRTAMYGIVISALVVLIKNNGLKDTEIAFEDSGILDAIRYFTREAGVRALEREIAKVCRKATTEIVKGNTKKVNVSNLNLHDFLGVKKYRHGEDQTHNPCLEQSAPNPIFTSAWHR